MNHFTLFVRTLIVGIGLIGFSPVALANEPDTSQLAESPLVRECEIEKDAQSCMAMAIRAYEGKDTPQSNELARLFAAKACEGEVMSGCSFLGAFLQDGLGGPKDVNGAAALYRRACYNDYKGACYNLGQLLYNNRSDDPEDLAEARKMFAMGCEAGFADSCNNQAVMLKFGEGGESDLVTARALFSQACEAKRVDACANSGYMMLIGEGGPKQVEMASQHLQAACDLGSMTGCDNLGIVLLNGLAGDKDVIGAKGLFTKACDGGEANACLNLGGMLYNGLAADADPSAARGRFLAGCERGSLEACGFLAKMAFDGEGGDTDRGLARQIYADLCHKFDVTEACLLFSVIVDNGQGGPQDPPASMRALEKGCELGDKNACLFRDHRKANGDD